MCRHVHVQLSPSDEKAVRKMYGIMVPAFASLVLMLVAAIALTQPPRTGEVLTADTAQAPVAADR